MDSYSQYRIVYRIPTHEQYWGTPRRPRQKFFDRCEREVVKKCLEWWPGIEVVVEFPEETDSIGNKSHTDLPNEEYALESLGSWFSHNYPAWLAAAYR